MKNSTYKRIATMRPAILGTTIKSLLRIKRRIIKTKYGNFYLDPASNLGFTILEDGVYEPEVTKAMMEFLTPLSTFIDLGANEGYHSVIASMLATRVIAIEPQTRILPILKQNLEMNDCGNVTVIPLAISDTEGEALFYLYPSINTGPSSLIPPLRYPVPSEKVKTTTLQFVFNTYSVDFCDLIKIDIEGAEYEAILGSADLFKEHRVGALIIEPTEHQLAKRHHSFRQITDFLRCCKYSPDLRFQCDDYRQVWRLESA